MIQARAVRGRFRTLRWGADAILIAILLAVPWLRPGGEPLVLLDVPARKFHVLGLVIFPQELYFLWLILAALALALFFFTALLGRLWCGWACPQTVFTDVFAALGRLLQGWGGPRPPPFVAPWRRVATHAAWALLSAAIGFHLVGYFVSPYEMLPRMAAGTLSGTVWGFLAVTGLLSYLDFAVVRQTFCKYLCPYARFQGVLMDRDSLVVGYDAARGEPRGKKGTTSGDCVDCGLCVQVCPTDIDIRDGLQLECIACTQCIDACNEVMERVGRPPDLIGYRSLVGLERERPARVVRPRVLAYGALLAATFVAFAGALLAREPMELTVRHNSDALYSVAADGRLGNSFTLRLENRSRAPRRFHIGLEAPQGFELVAGVNPIEVAALGSVEARVFVLAPGARPEPGDAAAAAARDDAGAAPPRVDLRFLLEPTDAPGSRLVRPTRFLAPGPPRG
jgi:cytochrome c oxidase accessory protein FixG